MFTPVCLRLILLPLGMATLSHAGKKPESRTFDAKGVRIHYLAQGRGEPVVLIHGLHSSAEMNWAMPGIMAALAQDHQVIALDLPGHGQSERPEKEEAYGVRMVDDVAQLLDELNIKKAHIVGYSLGGMIAAKFLARHPDRALSGVIGGMGWLREGSRLQRVWEEMPTREGARTPAACIKNVGKLAVTADELRAIRVPVIVLVGDRDPVKRMYVTPLRLLRNDWPVVEIEGTGHINCIRKPKFADEIVAWVGQHAEE